MIPSTAVPLCLECLIIHVGVPQEVAGPSAFIDSPVVFLSPSQGYVAGGSTWELKGVKDPGMVMRPVLSPSGDECGAWLMGVIKKEDRLLGLYHAETACYTPEHRKSVRLAESFDGGKTFQKPANNVVLDAAFPSTPLNIGEGDFGILEYEGTFFLYAMQPIEGQWGTIVAKSKDGISWEKFYDGAFSEPGVGGKATQLGYIGLYPIKYKDNALFFADDPWTKGIRMTIGKIPLGPFTPLADPLMPYDGTELISYNNGVNAKGEKEFTKHFNLFQVLVFDKDFYRKWLVRRDVWWQETLVPQPYNVRLRLARYEKDGEQWSTTGFAEGYGAPQKHLGYLLTRELPATTKLFDCLKNGEHFISKDEKCEGGKKLRILGWAFAQKVKDTVALFSCRGKDRFESTSSTCEGKGKTVRRLGFVLSK